MTYLSKPVLRDDNLKIWRLNVRNGLKFRISIVDQIMLRYDVDYSQ